MDLFLAHLVCKFYFVEIVEGHHTLIQSVIASQLFING